MKRRFAVTAASASFCAVLGLVPNHASAWEPATTHAGLAEQAALSSVLHKRLTAIGFSGGLFEPLTIPPADAPALMQALHLFSPSHGTVPDARGRQPALSWLAAGAALADVPQSHAANHFFDPRTKQGWSYDGGWVDSLADKALGRRVPRRGVPAIAWLSTPTNPFHVESFYAQYAKAVRAATPGERSRHMAAALVAAGATLHVLADLGVPSHVRGDEEAHFEQLGGGRNDLGSRFERVAALAYGRLGVPPPSRTITRPTLRDYFSSADGTGLADVIERAYFSLHTLPRPVRVTDSTGAKLVRPLPVTPAPRQLNLMLARAGATLRDDKGTCLARYRVENDVLRFGFDDECLLEQVKAILPEVVAYETGLLDFLLRGELAITTGATVVVSAKGLGPGTIEVLVEDEGGVRRSLASQAISQPTEQLISIAAPSSAARIVAVFHGRDAAGEPIVAVGGHSMTR